MYFYLETPAARKAAPYKRRTCIAEDLIVFKAFAGRDKDWLDIDGIVLRQGRALDTDAILDELAPLLDLKGTTEDLGRLERILSRT